MQNEKLNRQKNNWFLIKNHQIKIIFFSGIMIKHLKDILLIKLKIKLLNDTTIKCEKFL